MRITETVVTLDEAIALLAAETLRSADKVVMPTEESLRRKCENLGGYFSIPAGEVISLKPRSQRHA